MHKSGFPEWLNKLFSRETSSILFWRTCKKDFAPLNVKMGSKVFVMCSLALRSLFDRW